MAGSVDVDMPRELVIERLTGFVTSQQRPHPLRVAVDGPDAAGKTTLADELAAALLEHGRPVLRISADDFHRPAEERLRRGSLSAEGYFLDAFDYPALRRLVLDPLGPDGDRRYQRAVTAARLTPEPERAPANAVLVLDGVFLLRDELRSAWDLTVHVTVTPAESLRRALVRDVELFDSEATVRERYTHRYLPGQDLYRAAAHPERTADVVIDNEDVSHPRLLSWRTGRTTP